METSAMIILVILVAIVVFFITRELWCWYWKINEIRDLLKSIDQKLSNKEDNINESENLIYSKISQQDKENGFYICAKCGRKNPIGNPKCIDCQTPKKEE